MAGHGVPVSMFVVKVLVPRTCVPVQQTELMLMSKPRSTAPGVGCLLKMTWILSALWVWGPWQKTVSALAVVNMECTASLDSSRHRSFNVAMVS
jgi:hypothetical protein